jgi:hypothetical protein
MAAAGTFGQSLSQEAGVPQEAQASPAAIAAAEVLLPIPNALP